MNLTVTVVTTLGKKVQSPDDVVSASKGFYLFTVANTTDASIKDTRGELFAEQVVNTRDKKSTKSCRNSLTWKKKSGKIVSIRKGICFHLQ